LNYQIFVKLFKFVTQFTAPTDTVLQPIIDDSKAHQVTIGQTFQLNCSATFTLGVRGDIIWKVPNPNGIDVSLFIL